jgi:uncharacterized protein DUF6941
MFLQLGIMARGILVDKFTNTLSIFHLLDSIQAPKFPVFFGEVAFLSILRKELGDPNEFPSEIVVSVGDAVVAKATVQVNFENSQSARQIVNFQGLPVFTPNNIKVRISVPNREPFAFEIPVAQTGPLEPNLPFNSSIPA